jgi:hypothetical protein
MNELLMINASQTTELDSLAEQTAKFIYAAKAASTRKAYAADLADFQRFASGSRCPFCCQRRRQ